MCVWAIVLILNFLCFRSGCGKPQTMANYVFISSSFSLGSTQCGEEPLDQTVYLSRKESLYTCPYIDCALYCSVDMTCISRYVLCMWWSISVQPVVPSGCIVHMSSRLTTISCVRCLCGYYWVSKVIVVLWNDVADFNQWEIVDGSVTYRSINNEILKVSILICNFRLNQSWCLLYLHAKCFVLYTLSIMFLLKQFRGSLNNIHK